MKERESWAAHSAFFNESSTLVLSLLNQFVGIGPDGACIHTGDVSRRHLVDAWAKEG